MEASGTTPPVQPPRSDTPDEKLGGGMRALAIVLALGSVVAALFIGAFGAYAADAPLCSDRAAVLKEVAEEGIDDATCFDSGALRVASAGFGFLAAAVMAAVVVLAVMFAITGRRGQLMVRLVALGFVLGGLAVLAAAID